MQEFALWLKYLAATHNCCCRILLLGKVWLGAKALTDANGVRLQTLITMPQKLALQMLGMKGYGESIAIQSFELSHIRRRKTQVSLSVTRSFKNAFKGVFLWPFRASCASVARNLIAQLCLCVFAQPGIAASGGASVSAPHAGMLSNRIGPQLIVIGFLGGFVSHDEPHHPEVRMVQALRKQYPTDAYFGLFENSKVEDAYKLILSRLDVDHDGTLSDDEKRQAHIELFGHSWGAAAVIALSRKLEREDIAVRLTVQVDSIRKLFHNDSVIPSNVLEAANFYQTRGLIHGASKIVAADPSHTRILGNFRFDYDHEPAECRNFSWHARFFTKPHIEIECDPKVWSQIETLLRSPIVGVQ